MIEARQFPKISEYGLIGDARTAALVSKCGAIEWCCLPHFDSGSFFASILDRDGGGYFSISPADPFVSEQRYLEDTNVLETTFRTGAGSVRILDFFSVTTEQGKRRQLWPDHEILRIVEGLSGDVLLRMSFVPRPEYGKHMVALENRGALGIACSCHEKQLLLRTSLPTAQIN